MHFRQFLISALMVGVADNFSRPLQFAEKNAPSPQRGNGAIPVKIEKEEVNMALPPKAEHAKPQEKAALKNAPITEKAAVPEHASASKHVTVTEKTCSTRTCSYQSSKGETAVIQKYSKPGCG